MDTWTINRLREQADAGAPVEPADVRLLLDALDASRRAATVPSEFVVRVTRSAFDPDRWIAEHPLLRSSPSADDPADALTLGAIELRRVLADHSWPSSTREASGPHRRRCDRATADALVRNADDTDPLAGPLRWALDEVDRLTDELREAALAKALHARVEQGDPAARVTMLSAAVDRLTAANVTATTAEWGTDGFGSAADVGLCAGIDDEALVVDHLATIDDDRFGWPRFELAWISNDLDHEDDW